MRTVILLPFRGDSGGPRDQIFRAVAPHIGELSELLAAPIYRADSGHTPFSVGNSFNLAARNATDDGPWEIALLHEADFIVAPEQIRAAVDEVAAGYPGMVYAWDRHVRLNQRGTARLLNGRRKGFHYGADYTVGAVSPGGPRVVSRALWEATGGFHPGFVGWGYEDNAFLMATHRVAKDKRVPGDLINAWHPRRQNRPDDPYFAAAASNYDLWRRLQEAG